MNFQFQAIAHIATPFKQKFAIPRQSQSLSKARGVITFTDIINPSNACRGLAGFSHVWLSFVFHATAAQGWKDTVRPPRLGGNERIGVFASRSTFRPNPIGLSVVKNLGLDEQGRLHVQGVDLLDQTPILDIKPYVAYADSIVDASSGFTERTPIADLPVHFDQNVMPVLKQIAHVQPEFHSLLVNILSQDPRPAYKKNQVDAKSYHLSLYDYDIRWSVNDEQIYVHDIRRSSGASG